MPVATAQVIASTPTEQDEDAAEMDEAQVVQRVAFIADDEPTEVPQPGEQALDLPPTLVATQRSAILGLGLLPIAPVGRNHLHAELGQLSVQRIRVVRPVAD
jgi:hypothetical protein